MTEETQTPTDVNPELEAYIAKQPPWLASVIRRHGREVFELAHLSLAVSGNLQGLHRAITEALNTIGGAPSKLPIAQMLAERFAQHFGGLAGASDQLAVHAAGENLAKVQECIQDCIRARELAESGKAKLHIVH